MNDTSATQVKNFDFGNDTSENIFSHPCISYIANERLQREKKFHSKNCLLEKPRSKAQLSKMVQSGGFLGRSLGPLLKTDLSIVKNVLKPLAKSVLIPLCLTAAASVTDAAIQKKAFESDLTTLIILNEEMDDVMKIVKFLEESSSLIKVVSETIKNEAKKKQQKSDFLSMLLGALGANLLGNLFTGEGIKAEIP